MNNDQIPMSRGGNGRQRNKEIGREGGQIALWMQAGGGRRVCGLCQEAIASASESRESTRGLTKRDCTGANSPMST